MIVLNIYSKIEPICISKKLGLYIDNLPDDWKEELKERIIDSKREILKNQSRYNIEDKYDFNGFYKDILMDEYSENDSEEEIINKIIERMICIYFDYQYDDMPLGDWRTNCFDGRLCEEDYAEKIIDFINFSFNILEFENKKSVYYIYSSNYDRINNEYQIFYHNNECLNCINTLIKWGELFDNFLQDRDAYLKFDYLVNSIHNDNEYNEYHFFKLFSLTQLFLENLSERELDWKLPFFLNKSYSLKQRYKISKTLRQMRNKIAHGDFIDFEKKIENYSNIVMKDFNYDYSEYSKKNWIIIDSCCLMEDALRIMIKTMFYNNNILLSIKKMKDEKQLKDFDLKQIDN